MMVRSISRVVFTKLVESVGEGGAVGAADCMRVGEHHHVLDGEVLASEVVEKLAVAESLSPSCFVDTRPSLCPVGTL